MADLPQWVLLNYRIPREPSTPRIAIWRRLRRLGVVQLSDGLVALPSTVENRERLDWIAEAVEEADGEAYVWLAQPTTKAHARAMRERYEAVQVQ